MSVRHTFGFRIIIKVSLNQIFTIVGPMNDNIDMYSTLVGQMNDNIDMYSTIEGPMNAHSMLTTFLFS
jgi:hypothetical protein